MDKKQLIQVLTCLVRHGLPHNELAIVHQATDEQPTMDKLIVDGEDDIMIEVYCWNGGPYTTEFSVWVKSAWQPADGPILWDVYCQAKDSDIF